MLLARQEPVGELAVSSIAEPPGIGWRIQQGDTVLELTQSPLQLSVYRGEECILTTPEGSLTYDSTEALWRMSFDLDGDDALHGTGATGAELNQRGTESVSDTPAAPALPMVWSTKGWGLYFNTLARVQHDLGHSDPDVYQVSMHDGVLDVFLFVGDPSEILNQYTALTGRAGQPSLWPMGVWLDQAPGQSIDRKSTRLHSSH